MPGPKPTYTARLYMVVEPTMKANLESIAERRDCTVADLVREACRQYLAKHGEKAA